MIYIMCVCVTKQKTVKCIVYKYGHLLISIEFRKNKMCFPEENGYSSNEYVTDSIISLIV